MSLPTQKEVVFRWNQLAASEVSARVLLVDDEASIVEIATQILERAGHTVTAIEDPSEALKLYSFNHLRRSMCFSQTRPCQA